MKDSPVDIATPKVLTAEDMLVRGWRIGRLHLYGWQVWGDMLHRREMNWIDIDILVIHFERAYYKSSWDLTVGLLGFNACITWWLKPNDCVEGEK